MIQRKSGCPRIGTAALFLFVGSRQADGTAGAVRLSGGFAIASSQQGEAAEERQARRGGFRNELDRRVE